MISLNRSAYPNCLIGVLLSLVVAAAEANESLSQSPDDLGTLFYSSGERAAVVKARLGEADSAPIMSLFTLTGIVKRGGRKSTVWINGRAVPEGQNPFPAPVRLAINESEITVKGTRVRIGETLNMDSLQRTDFLSAGTLVVKNRRQ